jgi:hypothetical protein
LSVPTAHATIIGRVAQSCQDFMLPFFNLIRDICLLRRAPQDLPYSIPLLIGVTSACVILQLGVAVARDVPLADVFAGAVMLLAFTLGALHLILSVRGLRNRFVQAATALMGCLLAFNLLAVPIALMLPKTAPKPEDITSLMLLLGVVSLPLLIWKVVVDAHIFRHTLDVPFGTGVIIAMLWIFALTILSGASGAPA